MGKIPNQKNEKAELDRYEKLVGKAHEEIAWIRSVYKWLFGCITVLFLFGVTLAVIFIGKDSREIKSRLNDEVEIVRLRVIARIDEEFKQKNIQELIVNRVDVVASQLIRDMVKEKVDSEIGKIDIKLKALNEKTNELQTTFATTINAQELRFKNFVSQQDEKLKTQQQITNKLLTAVNTQMKQLKEIAKLTKPPELRLASPPTIQEVKEGYEIELTFKPQETRALGTIVFGVEVADASATKILDISRTGTGISMNVKHDITEDMKRATVQYFPVGSGSQQIKIQVSGKCKLLIFGTHLAKKFNIDVKLN